MYENQLDSDREHNLRYLNRYYQEIQPNISRIAPSRGGRVRRGRGRQQIYGGQCCKKCSCRSCVCGAIKRGGATEFVDFLSKFTKDNVGKYADSVSLIRDAYKVYNSVKQNVKNKKYKGKVDALLDTNEKLRKSKLVSRTLRKLPLPGEYKEMADIAESWGYGRKKRSKHKSSSKRVI